MPAPIIVLHIKESYCYTHHPPCTVEKATPKVALRFQSQRWAAGRNRSSAAYGSWRRTHIRYHIRERSFLQRCKNNLADYTDYTLIVIYSHQYRYYSCSHINNSHTILTSFHLTIIFNVVPRSSVGDTSPSLTTSPAGLTYTSTVQQ
jgi:hypothetical protein